MGVLLLLVLVPLIWISYNTCCLYHNLRHASRLGIPTICVPVSPDNPVWIALQTAFSSLFRSLPFNACSFTRYARLGWEFHDRYRTNERLGDAFVLVTPNRNWIYLAQAEAAVDVYSRNRDFVRCIWMLESLKVFGPSVSTAEGSDWQRQRKLTATPFNEQKSSSVWSESLRQANHILQSWTSCGLDGAKYCSEDVRTLAINVLAFAGFQKSYPFNAHQAVTTTMKTPSTYRDALAIILQNVLTLLVVPSQVFSLPFLPEKWAQVGWAKTAFKKYMLEQIADEKQLILEGKLGSGTLVSNLVRASEEPEALGKSSSGKVHKPLSIDEILGNMFIFNFAGHDTTSISLAYAIFLLVAHPEVQDWISEEINFHLGSEPDPTKWQYETTFPKLQRCLAVLLETLRLYNPIPGVPKYTGPRPQHLTLSNTLTLDIPPNTLVVPSLQALHTHPRYWGPDSLTWRPSRWIIPSPSSPPNPSLHTTLSTEKLLTPQKGTFIAWSEGLQNCPGKKFAQVEFVATMARLFRDHRAEVVPDGSLRESLEEARERVLGVVRDSDVQLLLKMRETGGVRIRWVER